MTAAQTLKRTPLYAVHVGLGAKMVPFAGYEMPVSYPAGITAEHRAVREGAGLFDVSHMGEFEVTGPDRNAFVQRVTCNDVAALKPGQAQYSALLTEQGTFVDDCLVYRFADKLMLVVNASNIEKDWEHVVGQKGGGGANVRLRNISDEVALLALQGPRAEALLAPLTPAAIAALPYYHFADAPVAGVQCFISRTGYTGEDGFELYCRAADARKLWEALAGRAVPCGLGARDTLRLEAGLPLYGNDIDDTTTPYEAGLGFIVKLEKGAPFTGLRALKRQKLEGVRRRLAGFRVAEPRAVARPGCDVYVDGRKADRVRSGTVPPTVNASIGTTYLPVERAKPGTKIEIDIRGKRVGAEVVKMPFVPNRTRR